MNLKFLIEHLPLYSEEDKEKAENAIKIYASILTLKAEKKGYYKGFQDCKIKIKEKLRRRAINN